MEQSIQDIQRQEFHTALAEMLIAWNLAEQEMAQILLILGGQTDAIYILTSELSAMQIHKFLEVINEEIMEGDLRQSISHALEYFDRLRDYRNHYIHGIYAVVRNDGDTDFVGMLHEAKSRKRYKVVRAEITKEMLRFVTQHSYDLLAFAVRIVLSITTSINRDGEICPPLPAPPQMPPLPERLVKNPTNPINEEPPAAPSQA